MLHNNPLNAEVKLQYNVWILERLYIDGHIIDFGYTTELVSFVIKKYTGYSILFCCLVTTVSVSLSFFFVIIWHLTMFVISLKAICTFYVNLVKFENSKLCHE